MGRFFKKSETVVSHCVVKAYELSVGKRGAIGSGSEVRSDV